MSSGRTDRGGVKVGRLKIRLWKQKIPPPQYIPQIDQHNTLMINLMYMSWACKNIVRAFSHPTQTHTHPILPQTSARGQDGMALSLHPNQVGGRPDEGIDKTVL